MTKEEELQRMRDSRKWPRFPLLPLTRGNKVELDCEVGILLATQRPNGSGLVTTDPAAKVYLANMYRINTMKELLDSPALEYSSLEEMYDDGWRGD
jgi:hypothetical protein